MTKNRISDGWKMVKLVVLAVVLIFLGYLATGVYTRWLIEDSQEKAKDSLTIYGDVLEMTVGRSLSLLDGLERFVMSKDDKQIARDFLIFAPGLHNNFVGVRNVGIAPKGILTLVYPTFGNEQAIGYNLLEDETPSVRADLAKMSETKGVVVTLPFQLRQGGLGMAARKMIYKNGEFWGIISVVIDVPTLVGRSGLEDPRDKLVVSLRDSSGKVFWGDERVFGNNPIITKVDFADDYWELGGYPQGGWKTEAANSLWLFRILILLIGVLVWLVISHSFGRETRLMISEIGLVERTWSLKVAALYVFLSALWIFYSDKALYTLFTNTERINELQTIKGWLFVAISTIIIYWLLEASHDRYLVTRNALRLILDIGKILNSTKKKGEAYQAICEALIKDGGYIMVWVGQVKGRNKIEKLGVAGKINGFFEEVKLSLDGILGESSPCYMAVSTGKTVLIRDVGSVSTYPEWRLAAEKRNFASSASIPIKNGEEVLGILEIYSNWMNVLGEGEMELLTEVANQLALGLGKTLFVKLPIKEKNG